MLSLSSADVFFFSKLTFKKKFKNFSQEHYQSVKGFGSRSGLKNVRPDLGPNCL